jgi:carbamoyltransferase
MYILGLTTMGDAAACLIRDGEIVAAAEEERFSRIKHHIGFPYRAVQYVLSEAGITMDDVDHVGLYWKPWILSRRLYLLLRSLGNSWAAFDTRLQRGVEQVGRHYALMFAMKSHIRRRFGGSFAFHYVEHHLAHAASTFYVSPFEEAAIFTADGTGEETTTMFAVGQGTRIRVLDRVKLPHSLGQFYSAITNFLGFDMLQGDEWKTMGLAAWGQPEFYDFFIKNVLIPAGENKYRLNWQLLDHHLAKRYVFSKELIQILGPPRRPHEEITERHMNIAASAQKALEEVVLRLLDWLFHKTRIRNLCLAGGVVFNSVMNGRILRETPFEHVYIQPAAGDAGCALGTCYYIWHQILGKPRKFVMQHAYWGPSFSSETCRRVLEAHGLRYTPLDDRTLVERVAQLLSEGHIVAWFQGRMEWGPRALGNRSFLADPRDPEVREKLNHQVKLREWFRPLAPSVMEEYRSEIFGCERYHDPFMITVYPVRKDVREKIPAVVHVDGTARPQMVRKQDNPRYWQLIDAFRRKTGIPCLLNTSFNIQEPIVCTPEDAVKTFLRSRLRYLVLENLLVERS